MKPAIKAAVGRIPVLGPMLRRAYRAILRAAGKREGFPGSAVYWDRRYAGGGDSGIGSSGIFAAFKAELLNEFVAANHVQTVIEFGCGDGKQLCLARYPSYLGFDVSNTAIRQCSELFKGDLDKAFRLMSEYRGERADLVLSLDVLYHLVEDDVFEDYMRTLFQASDRYVIIYSSDSDHNRGYEGTHVRHRRFTKWVRANLPEWRLTARTPNRYPFRGDHTKGSFADFFIYEKSQDLAMPDRRPICLLPETLSLGGIGRVSLNLAEELIQRGYDVHFFLTKAEGPYVAQIPSRVRRFEGGGRARTSVGSLIRYVRRERPRVLISGHAHIHVLALLAARLSRSDVKIICTAHTNLSEDARRKGSYGRFLLGLGRYAYRRADAVVTVSEGVRDDLVRHARVTPERMRVIYNPVVTENLLKVAGSEVPCSWLPAVQHPVIIGVGRLVRQKDFPTLIRAFAKVKPQTVDARLIILGEGPERATLEALVRELGIDGAVWMPGFVEAPGAYVAKASVFVMSSAWEGFGNVLVEAMAVGTPVVSTDCPSGPAEILNDGEFGRMVPVGDCDAMATAILATLASPQDRAILQRRAMMFSADVAADKWLELIEQWR